MGKFKRAAVTVVAVAGLSAGLVGATQAPSDAKDTTWGCPGCVLTHR